MATLDQMITAPEAARMLGVTGTYVYDLIRQHRLEAKRWGNRWVLERGEVERFRLTRRRRGRPTTKSEAVV